MRRSAIEYIESKHIRKDLTEFRTGDTVRVHWKVTEGEKERVQPFEGIVIRKTKGYNRATFTVRKMSYGVGVERIFPLHSPRYDKIDVVSRGDVNRNRLFYLRDLKGKASRVDLQEEKLETGHAAHAAAAHAASAEASHSAEAGAEVSAGEAPKLSKKAKTKEAKAKAAE